MEHTPLHTFDAFLLAVSYIVTCMIVALYTNYALSELFRHFFGYSLQGWRYLPIFLMFFYLLVDMKLVHLAGILLGLYSIHCEVVRINSRKLPVDSPVGEEGDWTLSDREDSQTDDDQDETDDDQDQTDDVQNENQAGEEQADDDTTNNNIADEEQTGEDQTDEDQADEDQTGEDQTDKDQTGEDQASEEQTGEDQTGEDQTNQETNSDEHNELVSDEDAEPAAGETPDQAAVRYYGRDV